MSRSSAKVEAQVSDVCHLDSIEVGQMGQRLCPYIYQRSPLGACTMYRSEYLKDNDRMVAAFRLSSFQTCSKSDVRCAETSLLTYSRASSTCKLFKQRKLESRATVFESWEIPRFS